MICPGGLSFITFSDILKHQCWITLRGFLRSPVLCIFPQVHRQEREKKKEQLKATKATAEMQVKMKRLWNCWERKEVKAAKRWQSNAKRDSRATQVCKERGFCSYQFVFMLTNVCLWDQLYSALLASFSFLFGETFQTFKSFFFWSPYFFSMSYLQHVVFL